MLTQPLELWDNWSTLNEWVESLCKSKNMFSNDSLVLCILVTYSCVLTRDYIDTLKSSRLTVFISHTPPTPLSEQTQSQECMSYRDSNLWSYINTLSNGWAKKRFHLMTTISKLYFFEALLTTIYSEFFFRPSEYCASPSLVLDVLNTMMEPCELRGKPWYGGHRGEETSNPTVLTVRALFSRLFLKMAVLNCSFSSHDYKSIPLKLSSFKLQK